MQMHSMVKRQKGFTIIELVVVILLLGILAATALPRFIDVTTQAHDSVFAATAGGFNTGAALYRAEWTARGQQAANTPLASYGGLRVAPGFATGGYIADDGNGDSQFTPGTFSARATGYPFALRSTVDYSTAAALAADYAATDCAAVFSNLLQDVGAPSIAAVTAGFTDFSEADDIASDVTTAQAAAAADFQAFVQPIVFDTGNPKIGADLTATANGDPSNYTDEAPACVFIYSAEAENFGRSLLYVPWTGRVSSYTSLAALIAGATYDGPVK